MPLIHLSLNNLISATSTSLPLLSTSITAMLKFMCSRSKIIRSLVGVRGSNTLIYLLWRIIQLRLVDSCGSAQLEHLGALTWHFAIL